MVHQLFVFTVYYISFIYVHSVQDLEVIQFDCQLWMTANQLGHTKVIILRILYSVRYNKGLPYFTLIKEGAENHALKTHEKVSILFNGTLLKYLDL